MPKIIKLMPALLLCLSVAAYAADKKPAAKKPAAAVKAAPQKAVKTKENKMQVLLKTNKGDITLELDAAKAPETVKNFIKYVQDGQYDGTIFHRVIPNFMVQGGGMEADMKQRPTRAPIVNEADNGLKNNKYTVAMARTSDPDSATAQFFINTNDNEFLNYKSPTMQGWGYAVFGKVISGQAVVDSIEAVATTRKFPHDDVPVQAVVIEKAEVLKK